jgi:hypothetical protein
VDDRAQDDPPADGAPGNAVTAPALAVVDSPFQLVSLFEAITSGAVDECPDVVVRARDGTFERLLDLGRDLLGQIVRRPRSSAECLRIVSARQRLVIGDPYSGVFHAWLAVRWRHVDRLVLLEDGASALRLHGLLTEGRPLTRAHGNTRSKTVLATLAAWRIGRLAQRRPVVLACGLPVRDDLRAGLASRCVVVHRHRFEWSQSVRPLPALVEGGGAAPLHVVLGSSLTTDQLLYWSYYHDWLTQSLDAGTLFVPHRREPEGSRAIVEDAGARILSNGSLPVELLLRDVATTVTVDCLPSTAAITLPLVRGDRPTIVRCARPPAPAWSRDEPEMRRLVDAISAADVPKVRAR